MSTAEIVLTDDAGTVTRWTCRDATAGFDDGRGRLIVVGVGWVRETNPLSAVHRTGFTDGYATMHGLPDGMRQYVLDTEFRRVQAARADLATAEGRLAGVRAAITEGAS